MKLIISEKAIAGKKIASILSKNKFTTVSVEHFLVITNPNLSLKIGGKYYNFLSTEFYGGKCVQAVAIKYLPYSKIVIDLDEINEP